MTSLYNVFPKDAIHVSFIGSFKPYLYTNSKIGIESCRKKVYNYIIIINKGGFLMYFNEIKYKNCISHLIAIKACIIISYMIIFACI